MAALTTTVEKGETDQENDVSGLQREDSHPADQHLAEATLLIANKPGRDNSAIVPPGNANAADNNNNSKASLLAPPVVSPEMLETLQQNALEWQANIATLKSVLRQLSRINPTSVRDNGRIEEQLQLAITSHWDAKQAYQDALQQTVRPCAALTRKRSESPMYETTKHPMELRNPDRLHRQRSCHL
jgi:hypothetical protein